MDDKAAVARSFVRAPNAGSTISFLGVTHLYKATAAETGGSFSLWEAVFPPGAGAPPHTHSREDEAFYVLEGELTSTSRAHRRLSVWRPAASSSVCGVCAMRSAIWATSLPAC